MALDSQVRNNVTLIDDIYLAHAQSVNGKSIVISQLLTLARVNVAQGLTLADRVNTRLKPTSPAWREK